MAPLVPRMHLFEIDDQTWFPSFLRAKIQAALTEAWTFHLPGLPSPAHLVAQILGKELGPSVRDYVFIDFCAGGGGPTPRIERRLNRQLAEAATANGSPQPTKSDAVQFVLTDLHPHVDNWAQAAAASPNVHYEAEPVDAANAPPELVARYKTKGKRVFRLFNLAFHHFDDPLARAILKNTVETSDGFGIFELQDRSLSAFLTCCLLGVGFLLAAPYYAFRWRQGPAVTLLFTYLVPVLPFVLVFDGWISSLRTRTPDEVEVLLRTCGAARADVDRWEAKSGSVRHLWPCGYLNWVICVKK